jgi:hypothetical protein
MEWLWVTIVKVVSAVVGGGAALFACGILFWQTSVWLKKAYWPPYTLAEAARDWGFPYPYFPNLLGVQKIVDYVFTWPAVAVYIAIALGSGFVWMYAIAGEAKLERAEWLAKREKERAGKPETLAGLAREFEDLGGKQKR